MLFNLRSCRVPPIILYVAVNGQEVPMELDTGASVSNHHKTSVGDDAVTSSSVATFSYQAQRSS